MSTLPGVNNYKVVKKEMCIEIADSYFDVK